MGLLTTLLEQYMSIVFLRGLSNVENPPVTLD